MRIIILSRWYNEEFFAPFFLGHYLWADDILILLDKTTDDKSAEIISKYSNTRIEYFDHGGVINDGLLADMISARLAGMLSDWVIYVDADELVFPGGKETAHEALSRADGNLVYSQIWWVYRHVSESDLNPNLPAVPQRRHGAANVFNKPHTDAFFRKPNIVKPNTGVHWTPGTHGYLSNKNIKESKNVLFQGVHWQMADVDNAIKRCMDGREKRLSADNIKYGWGKCDWTEEKIRARCEAHLFDPQIPFLEET